MLGRQPHASGSPRRRRRRPLRRRLPCGCARVAACRRAAAAEARVGGRPRPPPARPLLAARVLERPLRRRCRLPLPAHRLDVAIGTCRAAGGPAKAGAVSPPARSGGACARLASPWGAGEAAAHEQQLAVHVRQPPEAPAAAAAAAAARAPAAVSRQQRRCCCCCCWLLAGAATAARHAAVRAHEPHRERSGRLRVAPRGSAGGAAAVVDCGGC